MGFGTGRKPATYSPTHSIPYTENLMFFNKDGFVTFLLEISFAVVLLATLDVFIKISNFFEARYFYFFPFLILYLFLRNLFY